VNSIGINPGNRDSSRATKRGERFSSRSRLTQDSPSGRLRRRTDRQPGSPPSRRRGVPRRICSSVMPAPSQPRTSQTVMRSPRMQGLPPRLPGSIVILLLTADMGYPFLSMPPAASVWSLVMRSSDACQRKRIPGPLELPICVFGNRHRWPHRSADLSGPRFPPSCTVSEWRVIRQERLPRFHSPPRNKYYKRRYRGRARLLFVITLTSH
jgi:hypothetical protein